MIEIMKKIGERAKFGVFLHPKILSQGFEKIKTVVNAAEKLGYDSVWVGDHLSRHLGDYRLECWTVLSTFAVITKKIRFGSLTLSNQFRNPAVLAKMVATLDVISNGRLEFGIGTGWHKREHQAYGLQFPKAKKRVEMLEETIEIMEKIWTQEKASFNGHYYKIKDAMCTPKPVQQPHPPITIGGGGTNLLKVVAKYADRWDTHGSLKHYRKKIQILKDKCEKIGRDFNQIEKSHFSEMVEVYEDYESFLNNLKERHKREMNRDVKDLYQRRVIPVSFEQWFTEIKDRSLMGTPEQIISQIQKYRSLGVSYFILRFVDPIGKRSDLEVFLNKVVKKFRC